MHSEDMTGCEPMQSCPAAAPKLLRFGQHSADVGQIRAKHVESTPTPTTSAPEIDLNMNPDRPQIESRSITTQHRRQVSPNTTTHRTQIDRIKAGGNAARVKAKLPDTVRREALISMARARMQENAAAQAGPATGQPRRKTRRAPDHSGCGCV